jgi:hypothetical protein
VQSKNDFNADKSITEDKKKKGRFIIALSKVPRDI